VAGGTGRERRAHRSYKPAVEGMEALRLLSGAAHAASLAVFPTDAGPTVEAASAAPTLAPSPGLTAESWDAALLAGRLDDLLSSREEAGVAVADPVDERAMASGLDQLDRYLVRSWQRAGLSPQSYEDASQAVYATLLQHLGRDRFDAVLGDVGRGGVKEVFSKETAEGMDFFRAVDMVKKRIQRERTHQPLDDLTASVDDSASRDRLDALREAIDRELTPREARLIQDSMMGRTPAEIADSWGVAPKTVSNEKTRVLNKLREALGTQAV